MKEIKNIRIPSLIASTEPFRFIKRTKNDLWEPSIENINRQTYDYVKLHRISGMVDVGLPDKHTLAVTFDGSFILPAIKEFHNIHVAVDRFNDFFGKILLGGIYVQAIDATYIQKCLVYYENNYFNCLGPANNAFAELKNAFRSRMSSTKDNIILYNTDFILLEDLLKAYKSGSEYLNKIKNLTPSILIKGISSFINNSFTESLTYNWVSIEQIIDYIWEKEFLQREILVEITGRKEFLSDTRTWTPAARIEMFYQLNFINEDVYNQLSTIRKARNRFVHTGSTPDSEDAKIAFNTLFELLSLVQSNYKSISSFDLLKAKYTQMDPIKRTFYERKPFKDEDVKFFYNSPIPPIPGDKNWDQTKYEYPIGFEF